MSISLNFKSVSNVIGSAEYVMIYGWGHCKYTEVSRALEVIGSPVKRVFDCALGNSDTKVSNPAKIATLEKREMEQISVDVVGINSEKKTARLCKAGLTNLMLENYKRKQEKLPLIPLLFCYDIDGNKFLTNHETIASRNVDLPNKLITNEELRRCYKLYDLSNDPVLKEIGEVAKETMKFVKLVGDDTRGYSLESVSPFWEHKDWNDRWEARKKSIKPLSPLKVHPWKLQLKNALSTYKNKLSIIPPNTTVEFNKKAYEFSEILNEFSDVKSVTLVNFIEYLKTLPNYETQLKKYVLDGRFEELFDAAKSYAV